MTLNAPSWQTRQRQASCWLCRNWAIMIWLPGQEHITFQELRVFLRWQPLGSRQQIVPRAWGDMETYMFPKQFLMKSQVLKELAAWEGPKQMAHCIAPRLWLTETVRCYVCLVSPYSGIYPENYYYQCIHPNVLQPTCFSTLFLTVSMPNALVKSRHVVSILQV